MKGKKLFKIFNFEVKLDPTWFIIALLVAWSLASGLFPALYEDLSPATYWIMGIAGAVFLFGSVIAHELTHSLVARRFGLEMRGITLFIFGGVAEMGEEPPSSKAELHMALAGPLISVLLGFFFFLILSLGGEIWPLPLEGVLRYLVWINWVLAIFNLVPAFPLDGGRVLRSIIWSKKKDLRKATKIASRIGAGFGLLLSILGVLYFFMGAFIGGVWWLLIGLFLRNAAKMGYQQVLVRESISGKTVSSFMNPNPVTVPPGITVMELVKEYIYRYHYKMFPVVEDETVLGCIHTEKVKNIDQNRWDSITVEEVAQSCSGENTVSPDMDASKLLVTMQQKNKSRMMVVDEGRLVGIISLKDMLRYISLKKDLEDEKNKTGL